MRRSVNPLAIAALAAAAIPVVVKAAKPVARKLGKGIQKIGEKLVESVDNMEHHEGKFDPAERDAQQADSKQATKETAPNSETKAKAASTDKVSEPKTAPKADSTPVDEPTSATTAEADKPQAKPTAKKAANKVKTTKPATKKRTDKKTTKTVKAKKPDSTAKPKSGRISRDIGETG